MKIALQAVKDHNNLRKQFGQVPVLQKWVLLSDLCIGDHDYPAQIVDPSTLIGNNGGPSNGGGAPAPSAAPVNNGSGATRKSVSFAPTPRERANEGEKIVIQNLIKLGFATTPESAKQVITKFNANHTNLDANVLRSVAPLIFRGEHTTGTKIIPVLSSSSNATTNRPRTSSSRANAPINRSRASSSAMNAVAAEGTASASQRNLENLRKLESLWKNAVAEHAAGGARRTFNEVWLPGVKDIFPEQSINNVQAATRRFHNLLHRYKANQYAQLVQEYNSSKSLANQRRRPV
jgi:hypothetical protein